jgi:geranylgeranyl pyrophosphate synthase
MQPDVLNDRHAGRDYTIYLIPRSLSTLHGFIEIPDRAHQPSPKAHTLANPVLPTQLRLAQIVEMMHTTSLLHDDVMDASALRRGAPSAPAAFGPPLGGILFLVGIL